MMELILAFALAHMIVAYIIMAWIMYQRNVYHGWESSLLPLIWELLPLLIPIARIIHKYRRRRNK